MSYSPPDDVNLFEAPRTEIGAGPVDFGADAEAELIRRVHLGHEASVKSIGSLNILGAVIAGAVAVFALLTAASVIGRGGPNEGAARVVTGIIGAVALVVCALNGAIGYGLIRLHPWARWTTVVLIALNLLISLGQIAYIAVGNPAALAIPSTQISMFVSFLIMGYILFLLVSPKANVVFSRQYREIIARTPHIKYKTSIIVKLLLVVLLGLFLLVIVSAILSGSR